MPREYMKDDVDSLMIQKFQDQLILKMKMMMMNKKTEERDDDDEQENRNDSCPDGDSVDEDTVV